jgi:hypothetical protein
VYQGLWAILEGRFEDAERLANEALELARRFEHGGGPMFHAIQISRVRAERLYGLLLPHANRNVVVANAAVNGSVERYLGKLAATLGRYDAVASIVQTAQPDLGADAAADGTVTLVFSDMEGFTIMTERASATLRRTASCRSTTASCASRQRSTADAEILTSSLTAELLRNAGDLRFDAEREVELKGLEGRHLLFALDWR